MAGIKPLGVAGPRLVALVETHLVGGFTWLPRKAHGLHLHDRTPTESGQRLLPRVDGQFIIVGLTAVAVPLSREARLAL